jgi:hypothetical protein
MLQGLGQRQDMFVLWIIEGNATKLLILTVVNRYTDDFFYASFLSSGKEKANIFPYSWTAF